jgi:hypothetical protein
LLAVSPSHLGRTTESLIRKQSSLRYSPFTVTHRSLWSSAVCLIRQEERNHQPPIHPLPRSGAPRSLVPVPEASRFDHVILDELCPVDFLQPWGRGGRSWPRPAGCNLHTAAAICSPIQHGSSRRPLRRRFGLTSMRCAGVGASISPSA